MENMMASRVEGRVWRAHAQQAWWGHPQESKMSLANDHCCINKPALKPAWKMRSAKEKEMAAKEGRR